MIFFVIIGWMLTAFVAAVLFYFVYSFVYAAERNDW